MEMHIISSRILGARRDEQLDQLSISGILATTFSASEGIKNVLCFITMNPKEW